MRTNIFYADKSFYFDKYFSLDIFFDIFILQFGHEAADEGAASRPIFCQLCSFSFSSLYSHHVALLDGRKVNFACSSKELFTYYVAPPPFPLSPPSSTLLAFEVLLGTFMYFWVLWYTSRYFDVLLGTLMHFWVLWGTSRYFWVCLRTLRYFSCQSILVAKFSTNLQVLSYLKNVQQLAIPPNSNQVVSNFQSEEGKGKLNICSKSRWRGGGRLPGTWAAQGRFAYKSQKIWKSK